MSFCTKCGEKIGGLGKFFHACKAVNSNENKEEKKVDESEVNNLGIVMLEDGRVRCYDGEIRDFRGRSYDMPYIKIDNKNPQEYWRWQYKPFASLPHPDDVYNVKTREWYYASEYYKTTGYKYVDVVEDKGKYGEYCIEEYMKGTYSKQLFPFPYKILFNVIIPEKNNLFQEIDCIIIVGSVLFVVECKNRIGEICIEYLLDEDWKQNIGKNQHLMYNPLKQNQQHIAALENYLQEQYGLKDLFYYNAVALSRETTVKLQNKVTSYERAKVPLFCVTTAPNLPKKIQEYIGIITNAKSKMIGGVNKLELLSEERMNMIYDILKTNSYISEEKRILYMRERDNRREETNKLKEFKYGYWFDTNKGEGILLRTNRVYFNYLSRSNNLNWRSIDAANIAKDDVVWFEEKSILDFVDAVQAVNEGKRYFPKESKSIYESPKEKKRRDFKNQIVFLTKEEGYILYAPGKEVLSVTVEQALHIYDKFQEKYIPFIAINYKDEQCRLIEVNKELCASRSTYSANEWLMIKLISCYNLYALSEIFKVRFFQDVEKRKEISVDEAYQMMEANVPEEIFTTYDYDRGKIVRPRFPDKMFEYIEEFMEEPCSYQKVGSLDGESSLFDRYFKTANLKRIFKLGYKVYDAQGAELNIEYLADKLSSYYCGEEISLIVEFPSKKKIIKQYSLADNHKCDIDNIKRELQYYINEGYYFINDAGLEMSLDEVVEYSVGEENEEIAFEESMKCIVGEVENQLMTIDEMFRLDELYPTRAFCALNREKKDIKGLYIYNYSLHDETNLLTEFVVLDNLCKDRMLWDFWNADLKYHFRLIVNGEESDISKFEEIYDALKSDIDVHIDGEMICKYLISSSPVSDDVSQKF